MKSEVWRGQNSARYMYFRYKDSPYFSWLILSISLFVCSLLIFQIIIPSAQNWFSIRDEAAAMRQQIGILRANINFMSVLNKQALEGNRQLAIRALPSEKDFGSIINAITIAAVKSGVSVDDFSFNLGLISTTKSVSAKHPDAGEPMTKLSLFLSGGIDRTKSFITGISEKLPISQIESVDMGNGSTHLMLFFHSKPYAAPRISENAPIRPLSAENNSLFIKLSQWDADSSSYENQQVQGPSSVVPLF